MYATIRDPCHRAAVLLAGPQERSDIGRAVPHAASLMRGYVLRRGRYAAGATRRMCTGTDLYDGVPLSLS